MGAIVVAGILAQPLIFPDSDLSIDAPPWLPGGNVTLLLLLCVLTWVLARRVARDPTLPPVHRRRALLCIAVPVASRAVYTALRLFLEPLPGAIIVLEAIAFIGIFGCSYIFAGQEPASALGT